MMFLTARKGGFIRICVGILCICDFLPRHSTAACYERSSLGAKRYEATSSRSDGKLKSSLGAKRYEAAREDSLG